MAKSTVALNNMSHVFSNNIDINRILLGFFCGLNLKKFNNWYLPKLHRVHFIIQWIFLLK